MANNTIKLGSGLTSAEMNARRALLGLQGKIQIGRPKSALGIKKRAAIRSEDAMVAAIVAQAGFIVDNLLVSTGEGDTRAGLGLLDRAFGKAVEKAKIEVEHKFSLLELARKRAALQAPRIIEHVDDVVEEKKTD